MARDGHRRGDFWRIDDRSGFKVPASRTVKEWNGAIVDRKSYEPRHPQDFVRARRDDQRVPDPRPRPDDVFQYPEGGPFIQILDGGASGSVIEIVDGDVLIYRGDDAPTPADYPQSW